MPKTSRPLPSPQLHSLFETTPPSPSPPLSAAPWLYLLNPSRSRGSPYPALAGPHISLGLFPKLTSLSLVSEALLFFPEFFVRFYWEELGAGGFPPPVSPPPARPEAPFYEVPCLNSVGARAENRERGDRGARERAGAQTGVGARHSPARAFPARIPHTHATGHAPRACDPRLRREPLPWRPVRRGGLERPGGGHPKVGGRRAGVSCACPPGPAGREGGGVGVGGRAPQNLGVLGGGMGSWGPEKAGARQPCSLSFKWAHLFKLAPLFIKCVFPVMPPTAIPGVGTGLVPFQSRPPPVAPTFHRSWR